MSIEEDIIKAVKPILDRYAAETKEAGFLLRLLSSVAVVSGLSDGLSSEQVQQYSCEEIATTLEEAKNWDKVRK